jgi:hypothetical protein
MSRHSAQARIGSVRATVTAMSLALLGGGLLSVPTLGQDLPACGDGITSECVLADWTDASARDISSPFGAVDGVVWVEDERSDVAAAGLDILGVGLGRIEIDDVDALRESESLLRVGSRKKAVNGGSHLLVRVVLDRPLSEIEAGHSGVHVATDIDRSRSNNAPTGVGSADNPFAGSQDIYSLTYAATTEKAKLLDSDLSKRWYKGKGPYAAMWAAPNVLDLLIAPKAFGDGFRVITFVSGPEGGYDTVALGPAAVPSDGRVGLVPSCIEGSISAKPFTVGRVIENGQRLRDVEAPASWRGGASFAVSGADRDALEALVAAKGDPEGRVMLASTVSLFEDGAVVRQRPDIEMRLDGNRLELSLELGLTRRGYNVLRDIELESTGDPIADAWLERSTDVITETMPPFRSTKKGGLVSGSGIGSCVVAFSSSAPAPESPTTDDTAASA